MKFRANEVVLFQGDSITDGGRFRTGYHRENDEYRLYDDPNHAMGHSFPYVIAAELSVDLFDRNPAFHSRGVSGDTAAAMYARWRRDAILIRPTVLSVLVGINDSLNYQEDGGASDPAAFRKILRILLEETRDELSHAHIVLCEPFYFAIARENESTADADYKRRVRADVDERSGIVKALAKEFECIFVPLQETLEAYARRSSPDRILWDGIHPTVLGHGIIARRWIETVEPR